MEDVKVVSDRLYVVSGPERKELVYAKSRAQAVSTIVSGLYSAVPAKPDVVAEMMMDGAQIRPSHKAQAAQA